MSHKSTVRLHTFPPNRCKAIKERPACHIELLNLLCGNRDPAKHFVRPRRRRIIGGHLEQHLAGPALFNELGSGKNTSITDRGIWTALNGSDLNCNAMPFRERALAMANYAMPASMSIAQVR
jgi:hypothetical protein